MGTQDLSLVKNKIQSLIDKFKSLDSTQISKYTEEETKKGFIEPLFTALGWDFTTKDEISAEENQLSGGRVDYGFYLEGRIKFYVEAKSLKSDLHNEEYAKQAIRYSWNRGVDWAILTDFESIKIFYTQDPTQTLFSKLVFEIGFDEYIDRFDQLWLLSKDSFKANELELYAQKHGKKMQKILVGDQLYKHLNECRQMLIEKLGTWNGIKDQKLLDEGVQKLLDRLIFIRVAEDRKIEDSTLIPLLRAWESNKNGKSLYESMIGKFRELDDVYNSNLFTEHPFERWDESPGVTEKVIETFQGKAGYYEYDFKIMPADVLGAVYENYLGHRLAASQKGVVLDKDAKKRKEQGIYYTPAFIVDYIVKNALKPVLDSCKSIDDLKKIKVLDPACGSGSFLIKALEVINDKYKEFGNKGDEYTKITILLENIYGVDLDEQAVEIARLNLLLSALETRMKLPKLDKNIKNGNSLISGSDEELKRYFGDNYRDKKPFNWEEEFPEVFNRDNPGFDVIIGNPPYIKEFVSKNAFEGLHNSPYYQGKMDIWTLFACISIDLLKKDGIMSFIAPNNWVTNAGASILRNKILRDGELKAFIDFGDYKVFDQAGIQTMIYVFQKQKPNKKYEIEYLRIADKNITEDKLITSISGKKQRIEIIPEKLIDKNITFTESDSTSIFDKLEDKRNFKLMDKEVGQGIVAAPDIYFLEKDINIYNEKEMHFLKRFYTSVGKYKSGKSENYIFYICDKNFRGSELGNYPNIEKHFKPFEKILKEAKEKYGTPNKPYFYLHRERNEDFFMNGPKIVCGVRVISPSFFYTEDIYYGSRALNFIKTSRINLKYLSGILNSKLSFFWLKNKGKQLGDLLQIDKGPLFGIPIFVGNRVQQKQVVSLVEMVLSLNKELDVTSVHSEKWERLKNEIEKVDKKIDEEVYKLYGLTTEEIAILEGKINES